MAATVFFSILAVACIFMCYVLVEFHRESKRPQHTMRRIPNGVIPFSKSLAEKRVHEAGPGLNKVGGPLLAREKKTGGALTPVVLPVGIGRLAAKRAGRS